MARKIVRALVLLVTLVPGIGRAEALGRFVYQGRLLKADPFGPTTGPVKMVFAIYDQAEGGSPLWAEALPNVALTDGYYATYLGDQVALTADLFAGGERYLELTVNDDRLRPRERLASVPSALACTSLSGGAVAATSPSAQGGLATPLAGTVSTSAGNAAVAPTSRRSSTWATRCGSAQGSTRSRASPRTQGWSSPPRPQPTWPE